MLLAIVNFAIEVTNKTETMWEKSLTIGSVLRLGIHQNLGALQ